MHNSDWLILFFAIEASSQSNVIKQTKGCIPLTYEVVKYREIVMMPLFPSYEHNYSSISVQISLI